MNKSLPLTVSIVIPAYNEEHQIAQCLDSIAKQSVKPLEVIVVDNNSTDSTAAIAKEYSFVKVIKEKRQGIVFARNAGFNEARGDIIGRIDADSILPTDWVEQIIGFYNDPAHKQSVFTADAYFYNLHTSFITSRIYNVVVHRVNHVVVGYHLPWGSNTALPRRVWEKVRADVCLRTDIHEDLDLGIHLKHAGYTTYYRHGMRVGVEARRIMSNHNQLWEYLSWWPQTIKAHHKKRWILIWPFVLMVWLGSYLILGSERLLDLFSLNSKEPKARRLM